jgi:hypothetical protein
VNLEAADRGEMHEIPVESNNVKSEVGDRAELHESPRAAAGTLAP